MSSSVREAGTPTSRAGDGVLDRLAPLARTVAEATGRTADTWLVGGVVRDAVLGRPLLDVDVVVAGDAEPVARAHARAVGGSPFPLGDSFGCWRVAVPESANQKALQLDVCSLRGETLADDLAARDFTLNAMAVDCHDPTAVIDTTGGREDIAAGLVRMVSAQSLDDDPLRMLRAVRLAHLLELQVEQQTRAAIAARAGRAIEPSGERTFSELCQLLEAPESRRGLRMLDDVGLLAALLPELDRCKGIEQSRFHHLDVFEHTLAVVDNCEDIAAAPEHYLGACADAPADPFAGSSRRVLLFAALCHDLGKPDTHVVHDSGRVSFLGHDDAGVPIVDAMCDRWATSTRFREGVRHLVRTHLALGMLLHGERDARASWGFRRLVEPRAPEAIALSVGDRLATAGLDDRRRWVRAHLGMAQQVWADHWREVAEGVPTPLLAGNEVAEIAGLEPGPTIGRLVRRLAEEQAVGAVTTVEQAREFVRAQVR